MYHIQYMFVLYCYYCVYYQVNQTLPDRIIVFRDGVGDGQMYTVVEFEVPQIKKCFQMFGT